jgi:hypothetical protein
MLDDDAYGLSRRRVTLSTSGLVPQIDRLRDTCPVALAVSLHAPNDALRDTLVPINLHWKAGRFENAAQGFSALVSEAARSGGRIDPQHILWRHLALARVDPQRAAAKLATACPAPAHNFALRVSRTGTSPAWEPMGPPCPTAKWPEPVLELFCGRLEPDAYLAMAAPALEISDRWCPPAASARLSSSELRPPAQHLWRAEVEFYLAQWFLLRGAAGAAQWHLGSAAADSRARTFECYAAGAELARLATA